jgi:hypothetical protein
VFPAKYLKQRDQQEHTADSESDIERFWVIHFRTDLTGDVKANNSGNGKNQGKYGRPAVGVFDVFAKGRVVDTG